MYPCVLLDASMTVGQARAALEFLGPGELAVVRRLHPGATGEVLWYPLEEADRQRVLDPAIEAATPLGVSLDLHEHGAVEIRQLTDPDVASGRWTGLVVDGNRLVGWATGDWRGPNRGIDFPAVPPPPPPGAGAEPGAERAADAVVFPRVEVPEAVAPGALFDVIVGLAALSQLGVVGGALHLPADTRELVIQIKAENFTVATVRHRLEVDLNDLPAHTVTIPVTAPMPADGRDWLGRIEIEYSLDGLLIGSAWRQVLVTAAPPAQPTLSTRGGEVAMEMGQSLPIDLTVSISRGEADGTFLWTFTTAHPVTLPDEQVISRLEQDTAETFALRRIREMAQVDGSPAAELKVTGVAREVAAVMPLWFWKVLVPIWRLAKDSGRLPTLLLVSQESLVPWELATTDEDYVGDRSLIDPTAPQLLGAQIVIGRWRPAGPETPSGVRRPSTAPAETLAIGTLAVVVGEFGPASGMRSLAEAIAEGQHLTATYPAVWVKGTIGEVSSLLKGQLTDQGRPVAAQVLHVASHGEVDPDSPVNSGVILSDSAVRIDESIVIGSSFARSAGPLVFINACQQATDSGGSLIEGGLAAAFLQSGARAFVAPLWSVDDVIAKDTALAFYAETLGAGRPVGQVMRELRARFSTAFPNRDQTTPLAYAYYGHPGLILTRQDIT